MITLPVLFPPQDCPAPAVDLAMVVMAVMVISSPSPQSHPAGEQPIKKETHLSTPSERLEFYLNLCPLMVLCNKHVQQKSWISKNSVIPKMSDQKNTRIGLDCVPLPTLYITTKHTFETKHGLKHPAANLDSKESICFVCTDFQEIRKN